MKKILLLLSFLLCTMAAVQAQVVINEIMYNPPEAGTDSTEYLELYNNSATATDITGYKLKGVDYVFPAGTSIASKGYIVLCVKQAAFKALFGANIPVTQWTTGSLKNAGETVTLLNAAGAVVDSVAYGIVTPWSSEANGSGPSLELCDPTKDNNDGANWKAATIALGTIGHKGTPGAANTATCGTVVVPPSNAKIVITEIMYNPQGVDTLEYIELYNAGTTAQEMKGFYFSSGVNDTFPSFSIPAGKYAVVANNSYFKALFPNVQSRIWKSGSLLNTGESIELKDNTGAVVDLVSYGVAAPWAVEANGKGSSLILCDPATDNNVATNWKACGTKASFQLAGTDVFVSPGAANDCSVSPVITPVIVTYPLRSIGVMTAATTDGILDSLNKTCELQAVVNSLSFRPANNGLQFVIIDAAGNGIGIINNTKSFGYTLKEGDMVSVKGKIGQFNGYAQMTADTLYKVSGNKPTSIAKVVTKLDETTESRIVQLKNVKLVDATKWTTGVGTGGFTVDVTDGTNTFTVRVDKDIDLFNEPAPTGKFNITGVGYQFDNTAPFSEGYQLYPRYKADLVNIVATNDLELGAAISFYPNPVSETLTIQTQENLDKVLIFNTLGQKIAQINAPSNDNTIAVGQLPQGVYIISFLKGERTFSSKFVKE